MVVGATFAYFTASVSTTNDENKTTTVKTKAFASATMTHGSTIDSTDALPGFKAAKEITIQGTCPESAGGSCEDVKAQIEVTANIDTAFGSDVMWSLYKSDTPITCSSVPNNTTQSVEGGEEQRYAVTSTCEGIEDAGLALISGSNDTKQTQAVTVKGGETQKYYLVVEYKNNTSSAQDTAQGKQFTVKVDFKPAEGD